MAERCRAGGLGRARAAAPSSAASPGRPRAWPTNRRDTSPRPSIPSPRPTGPWRRTPRTTARATARLAGRRADAARRADGADAAAARAPPRAPGARGGRRVRGAAGDRRRRDDPTSEAGRPRGLDAAAVGAVVAARGRVQGAPGHESAARGGGLCGNQILRPRSSSSTPSTRRWLISTQVAIDRRRRPLATAHEHGGLAVDVLVRLPDGRAVAVEVDGPSHFCADDPKRPLGHTRLKRRLLEHAGLEAVVGALLRGTASRTGPRWSASAPAAEAGHHDAARLRRGLVVVRAARGHRGSAWQPLLVVHRWSLSTKCKSPGRRSLDRGAAASRAP